MQIVEQKKNKIRPRWAKLAQAQEYAPACGIKRLKEMIENGDIYGVREGKDGHYVIDLDSLDAYFEREKALLKTALASLHGVS